jgi:hypothetical protein
MTMVYVERDAWMVTGCIKLTIKCMILKQTLNP